MKKFEFFCDQSLSFRRPPDWNKRRALGTRMTLGRAALRVSLDVMRQPGAKELLVFTHVINSHVFQRKQKEAFA